MAWLMPIDLRHNATNLIADLPVSLLRDHCLPKADIRKKMSQSSALQQLRAFPMLIWVILIGTFFGRGTYFMVWPFLAVILYEKFAMSASEIGLILSISAGLANFIGFYVGSLSDRLGRKSVLFWGCAVSALAFMVIAVASQPITYVAGIVMASAGRTLLEPTSKAAIGDWLSSAEQREFALQLRYFMINAGAAIGPFVGVWMGLTAQQETFSIASATYLFYFLFLILGYRRPNAQAEVQSRTNMSFRNILSVLRRDQVFLLLTLANALLMFVYGHMDSSLVQYLARLQVPELVSLFSSLILINALVIVVFQFPILRLMSRFSITKRIYIGVAVLAVSQAMLAFVPGEWTWGWRAAIFVLSLGEVILFPTLSIQVDRMAPAHLRGSYFGAAAFSGFGVALSPVFGGLMLDLASGRWLYLSCILICLIVVSLYWLSAFAKRPDDLHLATESKSVLSQTKVE